MVYYLLKINNCNVISRKLCNRNYKVQNMHKGTTAGVVLRLEDDRTQQTLDVLATEEPLEISIAYGKGAQRTRRNLAVTMRTPGNDFDLALGFLFTEGLIASTQEVAQMRYTATQWEDVAQENALLVDLHPDVSFDPDRLTRHFYTSSSCGICGKVSIDLVHTVCRFLLPPEAPTITAETLFALPQQLNNRQTLFAQTGGIHAAALFDASGQLLLLREDVGRHNALDKLIGAALRAGLIPLRQHIVLVSGRAGFELVQKSLMAGAPILAAVGAASSLAMALAEESGMTLLGFLRANRANIYCGSSRIKIKT